MFVFRRNANITATRAQPGRRPVYEDTGVPWAEAVEVGAVSSAVQFRRQMEDGGAEKVEESEFNPLIR